MNKNNVLKSTLLIIVLTVSLLSPLSFASAYNKTSAENYLKAHSNLGWSTMALTALNSSGVSIDYLKTFSATKAIDYTKPILAITSTGADPRNFGNEDLIAKLKSFYSENQIGDKTTVNDDIFGILALLSSGELNTDAIIENSKKFIFEKQNADGGWGYATEAASDSNTTASAIVDQPKFE